MQSQSHRCHMSRCSATLVVGACLPTSGRSVSMQLRGLLDVDTAQGSLCGDQGRDVLKGGPMDLWTYGASLRVHELVWKGLNINVLFVESL